MKRIIIAVLMLCLLSSTGLDALDNLHPRFKPLLATAATSNYPVLGLGSGPKLGLGNSITTTQKTTPMKSWNLALRGLLELSGLMAMGYWGFEKGEGAGRYALIAGVPLAAAVTWGIFAVEGDPSRSGNTVVPTPGIARLALEVGFFAFSTWAIQEVGPKSLAFSFGGAVTVHYAVSYKRVLWLLTR